MKRSNLHNKFDMYFWFSFWLNQGWLRTYQMSFWILSAPAWEMKKMWLLLDLRINDFSYYHFFIARNFLNKKKNEWIFKPSELNVVSSFYTCLGIGWRIIKTLYKPPSVFVHWIPYDKLDTLLKNCSWISVLWWISNIL